ncbi:MULTISPECIES: helix-turn-helix domain-containing protein [unclassified Paenibacillus]|uniref:ArsR/SmtB family transcription factor n=1 Tax=unclassified Paenibacillus TaxID=185978 RepID=UPI000956D891|nr:MULTISPECIES: helix-turn-helix domain-containing protein [unclassified Paenibacillus]ASS67794.1 helix-turn-helix transcriptional regulator [Paenibacillus sp. RUD330]SIR60574.1 DNA-binding transcriptional regulator, ArsR family [Paenibacillus sp. RU4X]SIR69363.1 DNA-binding transcriptional regulator, ArsR family [Paenibacillus sp. RU4T]
MDSKRLPDMIAIAALIGDASRMAMLMSLIGGKSLPAGELAQAARVSKATASSHLAKLVEGGLLRQEAAGRHRYYRLAGPEVGQALEAMLVIAPAKAVKSLRESDEQRHMRHARTCYDHLAGKVGVALTDRLLALGFLSDCGPDYALAEAGREKLLELGVAVDAPSGQRRHYARKCLDWSERRHHLAGSLGAAIASRLLELEWLERIPGGRAVRVTEAGRRGLAESLGLEELAQQP